MLFEIFTFSTLLSITFSLFSFKLDYFSVVLIAGTYLSSFLTSTVNNILQGPISLYKKVVLDVWESNSSVLKAPTQEIISEPSLLTS